MCDFELKVIDWTAIGSIATTLAFIIAFIGIGVSIYQERKNRNFQLNLQRQEKEQNKLDEFVSKLLDIFGAFSAIDVLNYSDKFINGRFTAEDRALVEQNAINDEINSIKFNILVIQSEKEGAAKDLISKIEDVRDIYAHWARNINVLSANINSIDEPARKALVDRAILSMADLCATYSTQYAQYIESINKTEPHLKVRCFEIMECYEVVISLKLQKARKSFEQHLYQYEKVEQTRINNMEL